MTQTSTPQPWPKPSQWEAKDKETYRKLRSTPGPAIPEQVLHITSAYREMITPKITQFLSRFSVQPDDTLGSTEKQQSVSQICTLLKQDAEFGSALTWAHSQGEDAENVDLAIKQCIRQVHNNRKKRLTRKVRKEAPRSGTPATGGSEVAIKSAPDQADDKERTRKKPVAIALKMLSAETQFIGLPLATTPANPTNFDVLKAKAEDYLRQEQSSANVTGFSVDYDGSQMLILTAPDLDTWLELSHNDVIHIAIKTDFRLPSRSRTPATTPSKPDDPLPSIEDEQCPDAELSNKDHINRTRAVANGAFNLAASNTHPITGSRATAPSQTLNTGAVDPPSTFIDSTASVTAPPPSRPRAQTLSIKKRTHSLFDAERPEEEAVKGKKLKFSHPSRLPANSHGILRNAHQSPRNSADKRTDIKLDSPNPVSEQEGHGLNKDSVDTEQIVPLPAPALIDFEQFKNPPKQLRPWIDAGTDCTGIGKEIRSKGHDDSGLHLIDPESDEEDEPRDDDDAEDKMAMEMLKDRGRLEQQDRELLDKMFKFFKVDSETHSHHDAKIPFRGMRRSLMAHQAYASFFVLWREQCEARLSESEVVPGIGFTYLADKPGFGKSASMATVIVATRWLELAWDEVDKSREADDGQHLSRSEGQYQQSPDVTCPSGEPFGICCPCVEANPSSQLRPTKGIVIFMVPTALLINSVEEWYHQVDVDDKDLEFHIYVQNTKAPKSRPDIARLMRKGRVENTNLVDLLISANEIETLQARASTNHLKGFLRHVFYCTPDSYSKWMIGQGTDELPCGRLIRDEFHQQPSITNTVMRLFRELIIKRWRWNDKSDGPMITLMSGTPLRMGARDLYGAMSLGVLRLLRSHFVQRTTGDHEARQMANQLGTTKSWAELGKHIESPFWSNYTPWELQLISQSWGRPNTQSQARQSWSRLLKAIMIERGWGSRWFDREILMPLPRMKYRLVTCEMDSKRAQKVKQVVGPIIQARFSSQLSKGAASSRAKILHKCGTFPGLADLAASTQTEFQFGKDWMDQQLLFTSNYHNNVLRENVTLLVKSSPKMPQLRIILDELLPRKDFAGRPAKGLLFAESNEVAFVIQMWIEEVYSRESPRPVKSKLIYGGMPKGIRQSMAADFQDGDGVNLLVGVATGMGTGITLTRATFEVIVEQMGDPGIWEQILGRMVRKSNYNWEGVLVFELFTTGWLTEGVIQERRKGRIKWADAREKEIEEEYHQMTVESGILGDEGAELSDEDSMD